jgi:hypothetical protein
MADNEVTQQNNLLCDMHRIPGQTQKELINADTSEHCEHGNVNRQRIDSLDRAYR